MKGDNKKRPALAGGKENNNPLCQQANAMMIASVSLIKRLENTSAKSATPQ